VYLAFDRLHQRTATRRSALAGGEPAVAEAE
jgi:hypothetical protein